LPIQFKDWIYAQGNNRWDEPESELEFYYQYNLFCKRMCIDTNEKIIFSTLFTYCLFCIIHDIELKNHHSLMLIDFFTYFFQ
ncbi:hypothetical protein DERF_000145, partial [Dermatophagoides farinae]